MHKHKKRKSSALLSLSGKFIFAFMVKTGFTRFKVYKPFSH